MEAEQPTKALPRRVLIADAVRIFGGAERFALDAAVGLRERGWDVTLSAYPGSPLHRRAKRLRLPLHTARTRANGAPWTVLPLRRWLAREPFDLVLSLYEKDLRTAGLAAWLCSPRPVIVHSRECDGPIKDRPWIRWFHSRVAQRVWMNSRATRESALRSAPWLDADRVDTLRKGVDVARYHDVVGHSPEGPFTFGFAGQLVERKRVDVLMRLLSTFGPDLPPFRLRIAGAGPERIELQDQARRLRLGERVDFDGFVRDMPAWMAKIDSLVLPSKEEGWGYVLAEAAAAGRGVVALDASSVSEVTPSGAGAVLADPNNDRALGAALASVLVEGREATRLRGERLAAHATAHLDLDGMLDGVENALERALLLRKEPV